MADIALNDWINFKDKMARLSQTAADKFTDYINSGGGYSNMNIEDIVGYATALVQKYGEGEGALAAMMYDAIAELSGAAVPPAEIAPLPTYGDVAKAIQGAAKTSELSGYLGAVAGRLVKQVGADTTLQNAERDGAQFAWIPMGDTCAFCLTLASRGWQYMSKQAMKNGHAEHIHANCDCQYAVRFNKNTNVEGYDPDKYKKMYYDADGNTPKERINAMRREFYAQNKANGLKNLDSSAAEELNVSARMIPTFTPARTISEAEQFASQFTTGGAYSKVSYAGVELEYANEFNRAMNDVLSQYEPKYKLQNIEPMNMRSKQFKGSTADAAYKWGSCDLFYNKGYFKSTKDFQKHREQYQTLLDQVMPNVDMVIEKYEGETGFFAKKRLDYMKALKASGRSNVSEADPYGTMVHELGHYLDDNLFGSEYRKRGLDLAASFQNYSGKISAYATESKQEYVAESFLMYWKGEKNTLDPELVQIFEELRK